MLTREEAKDKMLTESVQYKNGLRTVALRKINNFIDKIFDYFVEQLQDKDDEIELLKHRVEEAMKPKTCDGCRYGAFGVDSFGLEIECTLAYRCSRGKDDMFKPKDNK